MKKKELIDDVILRLTAFKPSDDLEIPDSLVGFWLDTSRAALINKGILDGSAYDLSDYSVLYENIKILSNKREMENICEDEWFYIDLPVSVLSLPNDGGLLSVYNQAGIEVKRYRVTDRIRFKNLRFGKPSDDISTYTRQKDRLFFEGGNDSWRKNGYVSVLMIPSDTTDENDEDEYPIDGTIVPALLNMCEEIGRRALGIPEDLDNDGANIKSQPKQSK